MHFYCQCGNRINEGKKLLRYARLEQNRKKIFDGDENEG